jgi:hypothetical protein
MAGSLLCRERGGDEHVALASKLVREAGSLAALGVGQADLLAGAERAAALVHVLRAADALQPELEAMLFDAARGLRAAIKAETRAAYGSRFAALERRLDPGREDQPC